MLSFARITKSQVDEFKRYYPPHGMGCEFNLVSAYLWSREYNTGFAVVDETLIRAYFRDDGRVWGYCVPVGRNVEGACEAVFADAADRGEPCCFGYLSNGDRETLERLYPGFFEFARETDTQDYIYLSRDLATLEGKKYHAKRNHISKFYRNYEDASFRTMDGGNLGDAMRVMELWCSENGYDAAEYGEYAVVREALERFEEFKMSGALLYVDNKPVAMTMGSPLSDVCFDVGFEKALREYDGSYAVINNEFAKTLTRYTYINREEDLGLEGLRKAKLSYHPAIIYDRWFASPRVSQR